MSGELFRIYKKENDFLPKNIVFYRQTRNIRANMITFHKKEVSVIKQAHKEVDRDYIKPGNYLTLDFIFKISFLNKTLKTILK